MQNKKITQEVQVQDGIYLTDYRRQAKQEIILPECREQEANSFTWIRSLDQLSKVEDMSTLAFLYTEYTAAIKMLVESDTYMLEVEDFWNDEDLKQAVTENFIVIEKYLTYIDFIENKAKSEGREDVLKIEKDLPHIIEAYNINREQYKQNNTNKESVYI